jgi:hypothetical protein
VRDQVDLLAGEFPEPLERGGEIGGFEIVVNFHGSKGEEVFVTENDEDSQRAQRREDWLMQSLC